MNETSEVQLKPGTQAVPWLGSIFDPLAVGMSKAAGGSIFILMLIMTAYILGRKVGYAVPGAVEASEQLMVVVFAFPMAEVGLRKHHILFELVVKFFSRTGRIVLGQATHAIGFLLFAPLTWKAWQVAWNNYSIGEYKQGLIDFPIWPFRVAFALGLSFFVAQMIISAFRDLKELRH